MTEDEIAQQILISAWQKSPAAYAKQRLGITLWKKQIEMLSALLKFGRVFAQASHGVGKTFCASTFTSWHYDVHPRGITLTTAPSQRHVEQVLWGQIRAQRNAAGLRAHMKPAAPELREHEEHFALGMTATKGEAFQGYHHEHLAIVFDECVGIQLPFWTSAEGMIMDAGESNYWLAICNPTDTSSAAYQQSRSGDWYVMRISALDHPNIMAGLKGDPIPFPGAVQVGYIDRMIKKHTYEVGAGDKRVGDVEWFPLVEGKRDLDNPRIYRPDGIFESRVIGRWPTNSGAGVWTDAIWEEVERRENDGYVPASASLWADRPLEIGCDCAWSSTDWTSIVARRGVKALSWESHNSWSPANIAHGLKETITRLVRQDFAVKSKLVANYVGEDPENVLVKIDHDATGNAVIEHMAGWNIVGCSGASKALEPDLYPNRRSEVWFSVMEMAREGLIDASALTQEALQKLRSQALAPTWTVNAAGQREVEPKPKMRKRTGRSPDDMDAFNLAFCTPSSIPMSAPELIRGSSGVIKTSSSRDFVYSGGTRQTEPVVIANEIMNPTGGTDHYASGLIIPNKKLLVARRAARQLM